jgi:Xanthosine triphosphate pyrophosphatase
MSRKTLFFATANLYKFEEFSRLFANYGIELEHYDLAIPEIQNIDMSIILRDKVIKAYEVLSRPVLVDHSGLAMRALQELPQGLNKQFWEILKDQVCELATKLDDRRAEMIVYLGFCDGRRIHSVFHREPGEIAKKPSSEGTFHLDRVFIPAGHTLTLAEMSRSERDKISHRLKVTEKAIAMLHTLPYGIELGLRKG